MDYNDDWRACRKMTHREFREDAFKKYRPVLAKHALDLVRRVATERGARIPVHLKQYVLSQTASDSRSSRVGGVI